MKNQLYNCYGPYAAVCCCITGFVISIPLYLVAVALSWGFARGIPQEIHNNAISLAAAICVSLPLIVILIGCHLAYHIDSEDCEIYCIICSWIGVFLCGGLCSLVGGVLLFVAAAMPPPPDAFNPQGYIAFAAITGIFAAIAGVTYYCGLCGFFIKVKLFDEESTGQNANSKE